MKDGSDPAFSRGARDLGPIHVGIIMDGNGRWAAQRGLPRIEGHRRGVEALRQAVRAAPDFGIRYLTLYSFSTENWTRPPQEVSDLMALLKRFIRNDLAELHSHNVRVKIIGRRLSNFLMWQAAYAELVFLPMYWPDFDRAALAGALAEYAHRERRFGGVATPLAAKTAS